ncbi:bifunctional folylpolyglutamate synthase/dihydrofolate synthase [Clostridium sp. DL1XJH146]
MNYIEAMDYINSSGKFNINLGLQRVEKILSILGNPHKKLKIVHVGGTNGKGSVCAMIGSILIEQGYNVGMYISPFLEEIEESIQINANNITKDDFVSLIEEVKIAADKAVKEGCENPTQFELVTCIAFLYFYRKNVDYLVLEVGLGGRLDATNVVHPLVSVITSISYDHTNILGDTIEKIAFEKAGIIKKNVPTIIYPSSYEASKVFCEVCRKNNSRLIKVKKDNVKLISSTLKGQKLEIKTFANRYSINLSLLGKHQMKNCLMALTTIDLLRSLRIKIDEEAINKGLVKVRWKGRFELIKKEPLVIIDGAHNYDGIKNLISSIDEYTKYDRLIIIIGILGDKDMQSGIMELAEKAYKIICITPNNERAKNGERLMQEIIKYNENVSFIKDYNEAFSVALNSCGKDDLLLVCGSLYMIGDMRKIIKNSL